MVEDYQENYITGWIKIYRSFCLKGWYKKSDYVHLWIHILLKSTRKEIEFYFNGETVKLNPGQFITGRKKLSEETGINESKIERILNFFEKNEHQIEQQKTNKSRLITVINWEQYQQTEQQNEQQLNNKRTTTEQQLNTNKKYKNIENNKNYIYNQFYDTELEKSNNDPSYNLFIKILFGENIYKRPLESVLRMKEQVEWRQFKSVVDIKNQYNVKIKELLETMDAWLMKNPKSKNSTVLGTLRTFAKPK